MVTGISKKLQLLRRVRKWSTHLIDVPLEEERKTLSPVHHQFVPRDVGGRVLAPPRVLLDSADEITLKRIGVFTLIWTKQPESQLDKKH